MSLDKWIIGRFKLPGTRPGVVLANADGGCGTHHTCIETLNHASLEQVKALRVELVGADVALFTALGHYWTGMARVQRAELEHRESDGLKEAAVIFRQALDEMKIVRFHEKSILTIAPQIQYSAFFVRRHEVISYQSETFTQGLEAMTRELSDGYYPAPACSKVNQVLTQMMAHFEHDALIEGVLTRFQFGPK